MTKKTYDTATHFAASALLYAMSGAVTKEVSALSTWFIAGSGALLAVVVSNVDKLGPYLQLGHLSGSIKLFLAAAACNVAQRLLGAMVAGSVAFVEKSKEISYEPPGGSPDGKQELDASELLDLLKESTLPPVRWSMKAAQTSIEKGDFVVGARQTAFQSQVQSFLLVPQFGLLGWAAWRLLL